jgi:dienelactone hydrolase
MRHGQRPAGAKSSVRRAGSCLLLALLVPLIATCAAPALGDVGPPPAWVAAPPAPVPPQAAVIPPPDPSLPGPYAVGVSTRTTQRRSRMTGEMQTMEIVLWYPATDGARTLKRDDRMRAIPGVPVAEGRFPVLVFSHAAASSPIQSTFLTSHLASHGFVVAAPSHPGTTVDDCLGCGDMARQEALIRDSAINRPDEVSLTLDLLTAMDYDTRSPFFGALDIERAGVIGHSWGGYTAVISAAVDHRFRASVAMAPVANETVQRIGQQLETPVLVMASRLDDITPFPPQNRLFESLPRLKPSFLLALSRGGHTAYSDICPIDTPGCRPGELGEARSHELVAAYATIFLKRFVSGDNRYSAMLDDELGGGDVELVAGGVDGALARTVSSTSP